MAVAVGGFYQTLVDNESPLAPIDHEKTKLYFEAAKEIVRLAISEGSLEDKLSEHSKRYEQLKQQFGTKYSIQLATPKLFQLKICFKLLQKYNFWKKAQIGPRNN